MQIRLFHESRDQSRIRRTALIGSRQTLARLYVTVASLGRVWRDAESHHKTHFGQRGAGAHGAAKSGRVGDHMVRGHHQQHRVGTVARRGQRRQCQRRRSVAPGGLEHDRARSVHEPQLFGNDEAVLFVAHDDRRRELGTGDTLGAPHRGLQQRVVTDQREQLLGIFFS